MKMEKLKSPRMILFLILNSMVFSQMALAHVSKGPKVPETVRQFLEWEFHANVVNDPTERLPQSFKMEHFEFPLKHIVKDLDPEFSSKINDSLIFEKNGKKYIRWIINPEDTVYHKNFEVALKKRDIPYERKKYFDGFLTASRSLIVHDPKTNAIFSAKVSTNNTGGWWKNKSFSESQVEKGRLGTKFVKKSNNIVPYQTLKPLYEPAGFSLKDGVKGLVHQGMLIRDLDNLATNENYYLPGFAALHPEVGKEIAALNGSDNPAEYWRKNFALPLARAQAEFAAYHGLSYASAHMQQFAVELDKNHRPTGKIIFRDFQDANAFRPFFDKDIPANKEFLDSWYSGYKQDDLVVRFGMFKAKLAPSWIDKTEQRKWMNDFFAEFEKTYSKITGIPQYILSHKTKIGGSLKTYITKEYKVEKINKDLFSKGTPHGYWMKYFNMTRCFQGEKMTKDGRSCEEALQELHLRLALDGNCREK